jgi:lipoprotein NlpD
VVRPQDTLYGIAWRHNLDYRELAKWNNIGGDYKLTVGQVLVLKPGGGRRGPPPRAAAAKPLGGATSGAAKEGAATGAAAASGAATGAAAAGGARVGGAASGGVNTSEPAVVGGNWVWPTNRVSAPRPVPGGGILVLGQLGQDVRAAAAGRVVYTGNGLRGYGNLVIIKHGDSLLSSYAHNRELLVHEGQDVSAGQVIAHMGTGPHQISALYFEIRVNGKPVDPLRYLSASR